MTENQSAGAAADGPTPRSGGARGVTIAYIAETAGVSVPTVSKVLNGRSGVAEGTRAKVEALINRYGYRKPSGRPNILELVFRELENMWAMEIIRGVEKSARKNKVGVVLSEFGGYEPGESPFDETVERQPHCVLSVAQLSEEERQHLAAKGIPFVVFDPMDELPDNVAFVGSTNWRGGSAAAQHLIGLGHRRLALITGPDHAFCRARRGGFLSAVESAGLSVPSERIISTFLTREHGCEAARTLLALPEGERPTAIFTGNDMQALGVYQAARDAGLTIPNDLSVVGFDDLPVVAWMDPPLTTVHQPLTEMADAATELALALGRGETPAQLGIEIATTLAVRGSTAPPKGAAVS